MEPGIFCSRRHFSRGQVLPLSFFLKADQAQETKGLEALLNGAERCLTVREPHTLIIASKQNIDRSDRLVESDRSENRRRNIPSDLWFGGRKVVAYSPGQSLLNAKRGFGLGAEKQRLRFSEFSKLP